MLLVLPGSSTLTPGYLGSPSRAGPVQDAVTAGAPGGLASCRSSSVSACRPTVGAVRPLVASAGWHELFPSPAPSCRSSFGQSEYPPGNETVVFGGLGDCSGFTSPTLNDTWAYHGGTWSNLTSQLARAPSPRFSPDLAYDPPADEIVLFGGTTSTGAALNDTWAFSSGGWTTVSTLSAPEARVQGSMAYDSSSGQLIVFGGSSVQGAGTYYADTWAFSSGQWSEVVASGGPAPRRSASLVDDPALGGVILFGGVAANGTALDDTWLFHAGAWSQIPTSVHPTARWEAVTAYDPTLAAPVLFGGCTSLGCVTSGSDTWALLDRTWVNLTAQVGAAPVGRGSAGFSLDTGGSGLLLFGGAAGGARRNDTWRLVSPLIVSGTMRTPAVDVGQGVAGNISAAGGVPPYTVDLGGLPGCGVVAAGNFTCVPSAAGTFSVTAVVSDSGGDSATAALGSVTVNPRLVAHANVTPSSGPPGTTVDFAGAYTGGTYPYSFSWTFGVTGASSSLANPTYSYSLVGNYLVRLTVVDGTGASAVSNVSVDIYPALSASIQSAVYADSCTGTVRIYTYLLDANVTGGVAPYIDSWSDGGTRTVSFWNLSAGASTIVSLRVDDSRGASTTVTTTLAAPTTNPCTSSSPSNNSTRVGSPGPSSTLGSGSWIIYGLIAVAAVVAAIAAVVVLRRRGGANGPGDPPSSGAELHGGVTPPSPPTGPEEALSEGPDPTGGPVPVSGPPPPGAAALSEQILVHLFHQGRISRGDVATVDFTQEGIATALARPQNVFAKVLLRLEASGLLESYVGHVRGVDRRRKIYRLTPAGEERARSASVLVRGRSDARVARGLLPPVAPPYGAVRRP